MKPLKQTRRAWLRFMADKDWDVSSAIYRQAEFVRLSIATLILNAGRDAEPWARQTLANELATFSKMWADRRG